MKKLKLIFIDAGGKLRTGWQMMIGVGVGVGTLFGVIALLGLAFGTLFEAWGLTNDNLVYAPLYAQKIVFWHTDFTYVLAYGLSILVSVLFARRWTVPSKNNWKMIVGSVSAGVCCGALLTVSVLIFDSMRLEWPLCEPFFSPALVLGAAVMLLGCLCGEILGKRLIFDPLRLRYGRIAGYVIVSIFAAFSNAAPLGIMNGILFGLIGCVLYERGGLAVSFALQAGWTIWTRILFAWPNSNTVSFYRFYTVSDAWLTGGNCGAECGIGCTVILVTLALVLFRQEIATGISMMKRRRGTNGKD